MSPQFDSKTKQQRLPWNSRGNRSLKRAQWNTNLTINRTPFHKDLKGLVKSRKPNTRNRSTHPEIVIRTRRSGLTLKIETATIDLFSKRRERSHHNLCNHSRDYRNHILGPRLWQRKGMSPSQKKRKWGGVSEHGTPIDPNDKEVIREGQKQGIFSS